MKKKIKKIDYEWILRVHFLQGTTYWTITYDGEAKKEAIEKAIEILKVGYHTEHKDVFYFYPASAILKVTVTKEKEEKQKEKY